MQDILVVEDGLHERERLLKLFTGANYTAAAAESVADAERLLEVMRFRLAIIDIGLGDKSGSYLFEQLRRAGSIPYIIILTGNPSVHLKQRFLEDGAAGYIVKASSAAANESLLDTVRALLGTADVRGVGGIPLTDFLRHYVSEESRQLFLDEQYELPACAHCGSTRYTVTFSHKTQLPPVVEGRVVCAQCFQEMDPEVG
ncbi:MAG: response regulator [Bdellovibrionales bacterium]|nr:response regulator [Bdellovibrionales bacterium]